MEFIKVAPAVLAAGLFSLPLLTLSDSTTITWPEKFDRIEVHINVKNGSQSDNTITLKVSVDSASEKSRIEYKKTDENGKSYFEKAENEKENNKADQYKNLGRAARQFIKVQHKLNLIKSYRWYEGEESTKFEELCKKTCTAQPQTTGTCSPSMCCNGNCSSDQTDKYQLNKNSLGKFFLDIKNLNSANTGKYLSPLRVVMTFIPENGDDKYEKGSFWGSLIYGYVDYKYRKTEKPEEDPTLKNVVVDAPTESENDNYFANVPQKFTFKKENNGEGDLSKILEKLNKSHMKELMQKGKGEGNLCGFCCEDNGDRIECMVNRNYSVAMKDEAAISKFEEKAKKLSGDCCSGAAT